MKLCITLLLAITHALCGFLILMVASWFIAACSVAGIGFNYMLPAVVIRALALLRISSGYFGMLVGHSHLLDSLAALRYDMFSLLENRVAVSRKRSLDAMHHQSEDIAGVWIAWVGQNAGVFLSLVLLNVVSIFLMPQLSHIVLIFTGIFCLLYCTLLVSMLNKSAQLAKARETYQFSILKHIESAQIWHLLPDYQLHSPSLRHLRKMQSNMQLQIRIAAFLLFVISITSLAYLISFHAIEFTGKAIFLVVPIALLSVNDWLKPSLDSQKQLLNYLQAKRAQQSFTDTTQQLDRLDAHIQSVEVRQFSPMSAAMVKQDIQFHEHTVNVLVGSSGVGKSRFLQALAGLLEFEGERLITGQSDQAPNAEHGLMSNALYVEQFPYVLSDTLRTNLRIANLQASDSQLKQVLNEVGLQSLDNLDMWLGDNGRPLSGGEKKRLGIARALLSEAHVLLLDEPFEALDENNIACISQLINKLGKRKLVVLATHIVPKQLCYQQSICLEALAGNEQLNTLGQ